MVRYQKALVYTRLDSREIHVWQLAPGELELPDVLSEDERQRAARFVFEKDRRFFAACRSALRMLVSGYLQTRAEELSFVYTEKGKPRVAGETGLRFNISHSGGMAVFAFSRGCDLGVDVELVRPVPEIDNIARRFFCPEECSELLAIAPTEKPAAFFRCWTRKEAYIKATGDGLSAPLDQFQVTLDAEEEARFLHISHSSEEAARWTLQDLGLDPPYVGALAYLGPRKEVRTLRSDAFRA
jgi:4'-phosphopantetheinyl transferase